jgi:hypothetical protein
MMMYKNLRFSLYGQSESGVLGHPQDVMKKYGISYEQAIPQSLGDQWWFLGCVYDCDLPDFIYDLGISDEQLKHWTQ